MSKLMQNLVVLMERSEHADEASFKGGKMILNRFCIDEEAAFELSGVNYLRESSFEIKYAKTPSKNFWKPLERYQPYQPWERRKVKGKGYLFSRSHLDAFYFKCPTSTPPRPLVRFA